MAAVVCKLLLVSALFLVSFVSSQKDECDDCDQEKCAAPVDCWAGVVPDRCSCCYVCGLREGQECDVVPEDYDEFSSTTVEGKHGKCGENLQCIKSEEENEVGVSGRCVCREEGLVCGSDGQTYDNVCILMEESMQKPDGEKLHLNYWGPCKTAPWIVSGPTDAVTHVGGDVALGCEARGFPIPSISWEYSNDRGTKYILPSDDASVAVQQRGGPDRFMLTSWVQLMAVTPDKSGTYSCVATSDEGVAKSAATIGVYKETTENDVDVDTWQ